MWMNTQIVALNTSTQTYYTPWFPKAADNAIFTLEKVLDTIPTGADGFTVTVFTKNREDEGSAPGTAVGTLNTALAGGFYEANCTGLKELVRFKITFKATAVGQGTIYRLLPPTWYDTAV